MSTMAEKTRDPSTPSVDQFFSIFFSSFVSFREKRKHQSSASEKEEKKICSRCSFLSMCVCLFFFLLIFFFLRDISDKLIGVVCNFFTVSAKLLLESRDQIWHKHETSKYSSLTDLCLCDTFSNNFLYKSFPTLLYLHAKI